MFQLFLRLAKSHKIRLRLYHKGRLVEKPVKWYVDGDVYEMNWRCNVDYMSYLEVEGLIQSEGRKNINCLRYWNPAYNFPRSLRPLKMIKMYYNFSNMSKGMR